MTYPLKILGCLLLAVIVSVARATEARDASVSGWDEVPAMLARMQAPVFPDRDFAITDFGARRGADCTTAIKAAIAACHEAGGGRVVVPPGTWLTGAIRLLGNVNLHVSGNATLRWVFDLTQYPLVRTSWEGVECMNYSPLIYAYQATNVAVTGKGTLDGGAGPENWWSWKIKTNGVVQETADRHALFAMGEQGVPVAQRVFGPGHLLRPNFIQVNYCQNVLVEGVTIRNSPMWVIHPARSRNVTVRGVDVDCLGPNNDGCDPESSADVLIENCRFSTGDDSIAIKSGRNNDGRRLAMPCVNVVVRGSRMEIHGRGTHGAVVLGSECSGGIRNVFMEDCQVDTFSENHSSIMRVKNNAVRGGLIENLFLRHVRAHRLGRAVLSIDLLYEEGSDGPYQPVVRHVRLDHITTNDCPRVLYVRGFSGSVLDDISIADSTINGITQGDVISDTGRVIFDRVTLNERPLKTDR